MNREHANNLDLSSQLNEARSNLLAATNVTEELELSRTTLKAEVASILKDKANLQIELHDAKKSHSLAASTASVNDCQMRNLLEGKDTEIIEVSKFALRIIRIINWLIPYAPTYRTWIFLDS